MSRSAAPDGPGVATRSRWRDEEERIRGAYARRGGASRYSWFNRAHLLAMQEVERTLLAALARHGVTALDQVRLLEVGCGTGVWLREFIKWGLRPEHAVGVDLLADRIAEARRVCPPAVTLSCASAAQLEFPDASFDLTLQSMLFSSVLDQEMRRRIAREMLRVVKPGGLIVWYDYHVNNPRNPDVRRVGKAEIVELFPGCDISLRRLTLAPPLARLVAPRSLPIYRALSSLPWATVHYLGVIRRPTDVS